VQQPVRHRPSAVGNEPKRNARRPCMITQRLGAKEGNTPVEQQPAAMQDFDPTCDRCGSWSCNNAVRVLGGPGGQFVKMPQAAIAAISDLVPTMFMTRVRL
jgi:hypothetical protein